MGPDGELSASSYRMISRNQEDESTKELLRHQYTASLCDSDGDDPVAVHSVVALDEEEARTILDAYYETDLCLELPHGHQWTLEVDVSGIADTVSRVVS